MSDCCQLPAQETNSFTHCPVCQHKGKTVPLITIKSMLEPSALETIDANSIYSHCSTPSCDVVYFNNVQTFSTDNLKVTVFQKDEGLNVPICYCFGWTRERLIHALQENLRPTEHIREQIQANRCGCEVNNPQGACCLGNVTAFIRSIAKG